MMPFDDKYQISTSTKVTILIFAMALTVYHILTFKMFDLKNFEKIKVIARIFTLILIISEILRFEMLDFENVGQATEYNIRNGSIRPNL